MTRTQATEKIANKIWQGRQCPELEEYGNSETDWKTAEGILSFFDEYFSDGIVNLPEWAIKNLLEDYEEFLPIYKEVKND